MYVIDFYVFDILLEVHLDHASILRNIACYACNWLIYCINICFGMLNPKIGSTLGFIDFMNIREGKLCIAFKRGEESRGILRGFERVWRVWKHMFWRLRIYRNCKNFDRNIEFQQDRFRGLGSASGGCFGRARKEVKRGKNMRFLEPAQNSTYCGFQAVFFAISGSFLASSRIKEKSGFGTGL